MRSGVIRTSVRSRRACRMISWPAANGIRCVKPSRATLSPSCTSSATASSRRRRSATFVAPVRLDGTHPTVGLVHHPQHVLEVKQVILHRALGARRVALLDRGEQRLVLLLD